MPFMNRIPSRAAVAPASTGEMRRRGAALRLQIGAPRPAGDQRGPDDRAGRPLAEHAPDRFESAASVIRTALCAETRDGILFIFMPPVATVDDYLAAGGRYRSDGGEPGRPRAARGLSATVRSAAVDTFWSRPIPA